MSFLHILIASLSLSSVTLAQYDPKDCQAAQIFKQGMSFNSFCIGVKDGAINFPEGTGCLRDFITCDYVVYGYHLPSRHELGANGKLNHKVGFYFSKTPGTPGQIHPDVVTVYDDGQVLATIENGNVVNASSSTTYSTMGFLTKENATMAKFRHGDAISFPASGYNVDVNEALYATLNIVSDTGEQTILHLPSPVKFYSGKRDSKPEVNFDVVLKYHPNVCLNSQFTVDKTTLNSFCIGVKDGVINFPEGTGCLQDANTCDYVVFGLYVQNKYLVGLRSKSSNHLGFYFSNTQGTAGQLHPKIVSVNSRGQVNATFNRKVFDARSSTTYTTQKVLTDEHRTEATFFHDNNIYFPANGYDVDVNGDLYATVNIVSATGEQTYLHLPSPVKFYSGQRDVQKDDTEDKDKGTAKYDPTHCHGAQITPRPNMTLNSFCIGVKDGAINFPEGTGCLQDFQTCDYVVFGYFVQDIYIVTLNSKASHLSFYFSNTPGTPGQAHPAVVAINNEGKVLATFKNGITINAASSTTYISKGVISNGTGRVAAFHHDEIISFPANGYDLDVTEPLYATVNIVSATGEQIYLHLPSPVKFYSGQRDGKTDDTKGKDTKDKGSDGKGTKDKDTNEKGAKDKDNKGEDTKGVASSKKPDAANVQKQSSKLGLIAIIAIVAGVLVGIILLAGIVLFFLKTSGSKSDSEKNKSAMPIEEVLEKPDQQVATDNLEAEPKTVDSDTPKNFNA